MTNLLLLIFVAFSGLCMVFAVDWDRIFQGYGYAKNPFMEPAPGPSNPGSGRMFTTHGPNDDLEDHQVLPTAYPPTGNQDDEDYPEPPRVDRRGSCNDCGQESYPGLGGSNCQMVMSNQGQICQVCVQSDGMGSIRYSQRCQSGGVYIQPNYETVRYQYPSYGSGDIAYVVGK